METTLLNRITNNPASVNPESYRERNAYLRGTDFKDVGKRKFFMKISLKNFALLEEDDI